MDALRTISVSRSGYWSRGPASPPRSRVARLGIGADTAIFSLMDAVMWRMLPVRDPQTLLVVGRTPARGFPSGVTYPIFRAMRENSSMADLASSTPRRSTSALMARLNRVCRARLVMGNYFSLLLPGGPSGAPSVRMMTRWHGHPVAMLSHGYWERRFGRDPDVVGRTIRSPARCSLSSASRRRSSSVRSRHGARPVRAADDAAHGMPAYEESPREPDCQLRPGSGPGAHEDGIHSRAGGSDARRRRSAQEPPPAAWRADAKGGPPPPRVAMSLRHSVRLAASILAAAVRPARHRGPRAVTACANTGGPAAGAWRRPDDRNTPCASRSAPAATASSVSC